MNLHFVVETGKHIFIYKFLPWEAGIVLQSMLKHIANPDLPITFGHLFKFLNLLDENGISL